MQKTLFDMTPKKPEILKRLIPVTIEDMHTFDNELYAKLPEPVLYNHCFHYLHSYFAGVKKLYRLDTADGFITVAQKYNTKPRYYIHSPICEYVDIVEIYNQLQEQSEVPVRIIDLNQAQVDAIVSNEPEKWKVIKDGKDVIFDLKTCIEMKGNKFKGIRNGINQFKKVTHTVLDMNLETIAEDAVQVIRNWQEKQGKKYFRVTVGRDVEIFRRFWQEVDNHNTFGIVVYNENNEPIAATMGCRSPKNPEMGMELTTKVDIDYKGLTDYISLLLFEKMWAAGIRYTNEAGIYSPGTRFNKEKWQPIDYYPMFQLERA